MHFRNAILLVGLIISYPSFAVTPTAESVEKLLTAMNIQYGMDLVFENALKDQQSDNNGSFEDDDSQKNNLQKKRDAYIKEGVIDYLRKNYGYSHLKGGLIKWYQEIFSQREVDELLRFYTTSEGGVISKKHIHLQLQLLQEQKKMDKDLMANVDSLVNDLAERFDNENAEAIELEKRKNIENSLDELLKASQGLKKQ